jgi:integrase
MQTIITNKLINNIAPQAKPFEVRDTQLKGLLLRVQPSGVMTYYMEYKRGKRVKIGRADAMTPFQAREIAKSVLVEVYQGEDPADKKREIHVHSYLQFLDDIYKPWLLSNLRTGEKTYDRLKNSFSEFHTLKLNDINPMAVEKWRARRQKDGLKATSINRELADLRACLNRAVQWGILEVELLTKVKPCRVDSNPSPRYLKPDEEARLRQALDEREKKLLDGRESHNKWRAQRKYTLYSSLSQLDFADHLKPAVLLSINTGLRRGELFGLKWTDIDFNQRSLTVTGDNAKSGKTRHIPLNDEAFNVLRKWKSQQGLKSVYVFTGNNGRPFHDVRTSWDKVLTSADINNFRWHDLRHTFASKLVMAGVDLNTVRELLGHTDYKMTLKYAHLAPEHKAAAVARLQVVGPDKSSGLNVIQKVDSRNRCDY